MSLEKYNGLSAELRARAQIVAARMAVLESFPEHDRALVQDCDPRIMLEAARAVSELVQRVWELSPPIPMDARLRGSDMARLAEKARR